MQKQSILVKIGLFLVILVVINLISYQLFFRVDFTADQRYTLSNATKDVLKDLDGILTVKAYFSEDLPPQLLNTRKEFRDQLVEYEKRSQGNLVFEFVNPNENDDTEREAQQAGINPLIVNVTERDQVQQLRAYMGAVMQMEDRTEIIPVIEPGAAMEYGLTTAIKKLSTTDKPKLGLIQGNGEGVMGSIPQLSAQLQILYDIEPYYLTDTTDVPPYYRTLLWINPQDTISQLQFSKLDNFLNNGGGIFLSYGNYQGAPSSGFITAANDIGLIGWLSNKGIALTDQLVTDVNCANVGVPQQLGPFSVTAQVQFPYFPIISNFEDHPAVNGLEAMLLPLGNAVLPLPSDSSVNITTLAYTSEQSGSSPLPLMVDVNREWTPADFPQSRQGIAVAADNLPGKLVVVGSGNFAVNGTPGQQQQQVHPDNINFVANAIDWMSDDTGLNDLRTKSITARPLDPVEDSTRNLLKYGNVIFPMLLLLGYSFYRRQRNMKKRQRWLEGKYI